MNIRNKIFFQVLALSTFVSCSEIETSINITEAEQLSLATWVEDMNGELAESAKLHPFVDGMYTSPKLKIGGGDISYGDWVWLDYKGTDLTENVADGEPANIFANNDKDVAERILGSKYKLGRVYYGAQPVKIAENNYTLTEGQYVALQEMSIGDEVQLLMPSNMAYMSSGSGAIYAKGYEGNVTIGVNKPAIMNMTPKWKTLNIETYESDLVWEYAKDQLGKTYKLDTIARNLYASITNMTLEAIKGKTSLTLKAVAQKDGVVISPDLVAKSGFEFRLMSTSDTDWTDLGIVAPASEFTASLLLTSLTDDKDYMFRSYADLKDGTRLSSVFEYNSTDDPDAEPDPDEDDINIAGSFTGFDFYYSGRFIQVHQEVNAEQIAAGIAAGDYVLGQPDGFLFDTNYKDLAFKQWGEVIGGDPLKYSAFDLISAFETIVAPNELTFGSCFTMVFTSSYGYGVDGKVGEYTNGGTITTTIQPYAPLVFNVQITDKKIDVIKDDELTKVVNN